MNTEKLLARTLISVLACTAAACSNDLEQNVSPADERGEQITVIATAGMPQDKPSTRLVFDDTSIQDKLTITWRTAGETFSVLDGTAGTTPSTFTLQSVDASDAHKASFEGEITPAAGTTYYAVYPALAAGSADATSIALDMTNQTGTKYDESKVYMYGSSTYTAGGALNFTFKHLTAILKLTLNFPAEAGTTLPDMDITPLTRGLSGASMTDATFSADAGLYTSAKVNITTATHDNQTSGDLTLSGTFPLSTAAIPSAPVYLHILPGALTDFKVTATVDGKSYSGTITASATLTAGNMYTKTVEMKEDPFADAKVGDFYCKGSDGNGYLVSGSAILTKEQVDQCIGIVYCTDTKRIGEAAKDALAKNNATAPHGLVMALTNAHEGCRWGDNGKDESGSVDGSDPFLNNTANAKRMYENVNGYAETHWILNTYKDGTTLQDTYSAFYHANLYGTADNGKYAAPANTTGWFIPSMGQWWDILSNLGGINLSGYQTSENISITTNESEKAVDNMNKYLGKIEHAKKISTPEYFWSSSEYSSSYACYVGFSSSGYLRLGDDPKNLSTSKVRCVFAF